MPRITDERREARREQVLEAARACPQDHGLEAMSMEMIIVRSGLSTGAVYGYFKGKDENPGPPRLSQFTEQMLRAIADFGQDKRDGVDRLLVSLHGWSHSQSDPRPQGPHPRRLPQTARTVRRHCATVAGGRDVRCRRRS
jgi:AcrR family transcriptional regulator